MSMVSTARPIGSVSRPPSCWRGRANRLLAKEVQERLLRHFPSERVPAVPEIRAALEDGPEFVQPERHRWQFGREAGPWQGRYRHSAV
jgi:hypothetical protein